MKREIGLARVRSNCLQQLHHHHHRLCGLLRLAQVNKSVDEEQGQLQLPALIPVGRLIGSLLLGHLRRRYRRLGNVARVSIAPESHPPILGIRASPSQHTQTCRL